MSEGFCPAPKCGKRISRAHIFCLGHWGELAEDLRFEIRTAWDVLEKAGPRPRTNVSSGYQTWRAKNVAAAMAIQKGIDFLKNKAAAATDSKAGESSPVS